jgi:predicted permease
MGILAWLGRRRRELDLDEEDFRAEIRAHLAIATEEQVCAGVDRNDARYAALREFGNVTKATDAARRVWTPRWLGGLRDLSSDVTYAVRALVKNRGFSLTVIGVLTLGIGLNGTVFTMLKGLVLTPIAGVESAATLRVLFRETDSGRIIRISYPDYQHIRDNDRTFSGLMASGYFDLNVGRGRSARQVSGELVTGNYFQVLGVRAQLGRTLLPSDEVAPGRHPVVVLSDGMWRRDFGADPQIVGKTIDVNNYRLTIVGIADPSFHGTILSYDVELFVPVMMAGQLGIGNPAAPSPNVVSDSRYGMLFPQGHLRPEMTDAHATAQADAIWATLSAERPLTDPAQRLRVVPFWQSPTGGQRYMMPTLIVLIGMGLLVLAIACANIAGLVLVRGVSRRGEIAVRLALGATRARVVRLLLVENVVLALPGAALGMLLAYRGLPFFIRYAEWLSAPQRLFFNVEVDALVIGFAAAAACGCALLFGFVPALQSSRVDLVSVINEDASPRGAARGRMRAGLVVAQVAVSLLLLVGAGLTSRSLDAARRLDPGFDATHVTAVAVDVRQNGYDQTRGRVFYRRLLDSARDDAGIESASLAEYTPLGFLDTRTTRVAVDGYEPRKGEDLAFMSNAVSPDYFRSLNIDIVAGRAFEDRDDERGAPVIVVNNTLARRFWGGAGNALDKRIRIADREWRTVIGVVADVKYSRVNEAPRPYFYLPFLQSYRASMVLHTRGASPVEALVAQARSRVTALDGDLPILFARPLTEQIMGALFFLRFAALMLFLFGAAGMTLAALGTYGLVSYTVKQSTHEIGIRMALGASGASVVRQFLRRGLRLGAIGVVLGSAGALGAARLLGNVLFGVSATDASSFARALAIVFGGVIAATIIPAWRAARTNPLSALRHQ